MRIRRIITSAIAILCILGIAYGLGSWLWLNRNLPEQKEAANLITKVRVLEVELQDMEIFVKSSGKVEAAKIAQISTELMGKITNVSSKLEVGEVIAKDQLIARIDPSDYQTALANALADQANGQAAVADAKLHLVQEQARAEQNVREWKRLGKGQPSDLVARIPQLVSARARLGAAEAAVMQSEQRILKAKRDLGKTTILAPYDLMVERKLVEQGDFVMTGGLLVQGHSAGHYRVRLPITLSDYILIKKNQKPIELVANLGSSKLIWKAKFTRDEGMVDRSTLTIPVVAEVLPNKEQSNFPLPPAGLYVEAIVHADTRKNVVVIPREAVQLGNKVLLVDVEGKLRVRKVEVKFTNDKNALVEGVVSGELVVVSPLETPVEGMEVEIVTGEPVSPERG